jgi:hypothetical protein
MAVIMIIEKPEDIFAKIKVLQIMIESTLNIVLSDTKDAEEWLEIVNKLDNNGIMTSILNIKTMIRKHGEKEEICSQIIGTIKRIGIIEDTIERNDWYTQMEELKEYFKDLNGGNNHNRNTTELNINSREHCTNFIRTPRQAKKWISHQRSTGLKKVA